MVDVENLVRQLRERLIFVEEALTRLEQLADSTKAKTATSRRRGRKSMGADERSVVSERMRRYWAGRRAARGEGKGGG